MSYPTRKKRRAAHISEVEFTVRETAVSTHIPNCQASRAGPKQIASPLTWRRAINQKALAGAFAIATVACVVNGCALRAPEAADKQSQAQLGDSPTTGPCPDADNWDQDIYPVSDVEGTSTSQIRWQTFLIISTDPATGQTSGRNALLQLPSALAPGDTTPSFIQQLDAIWTRENAPPNAFDNPPHTAPGPQGVFLYVQFGSLCMTTSDRKQHLVTPNRMVWAADTTGLGHSTRTVNGRPVIYANARLNSTAKVQFKECSSQYPCCKRR